MLPADHELAKLEEIPVEAFADEAFIQLKRDENDEVAEIFAGSNTCRMQVSPLGTIMP